MYKEYLVTTFNFKRSFAIVLLKEYEKLVSNLSVHYLLLYKGVVYLQ